MKSREYFPRRLRQIRRHTAALWSVVLLVTALFGGTGIVSTQTAEAATSGWYVATVPGTGADDVLLGSTCANALQCWAVGITLVNIGSSQSSPSPLLEAWNGTTWTLVPMPLPGGEGGGLFDATCVNGSDCWAVGAVVASGSGNPTGTLIEQWNGTSWSVVPSPTPSGPGVVGAILSSVSCASASSCMAVGYATDVNGNNLTDVVEQWNGSSWTIVPGAATGQAFDQLLRVQCPSASNCWAVGNAGPASQMSGFLPVFPGAVGDQGLIEHWDGSAWSIVPSVTEPAPSGGYLSGLECVGTTNCWASGATTDPVSGTASGLLMEHWDGSSWTDASASVPGSRSPGLLAGISCLSAAQCWAVGSMGSFNNGGSGAQPQSVVEYWNGSSWSVQPSPNVTALSFLNSVSCVPSVGCLADGSTLTNPNGNGDPGLRAFVEQLTFPPASSQGTVLAARDGGVFAYGTAPFEGSMGGQHLNAPIVGVATTPDGQGYWLAASDGGVFAFGDAPFEGSMGGRHLNAPIVGIAPTRNGQGYWLVAADGGVFAFGNAGFHGSMGGTRLNAPVVAVAATDHGGYWLVASDGGVFSFGGASFHGSAGGTRLNAPVTGVTATPDGQGYWLAGSDGGVFTYGDAAYFGSVPGQGITAQAPVVGITSTPTGSGYWLAGANGAVYTYGDSTFLGAPDAGHLVAPVSAIARS
jgi:hypothetical protein